MQGDFDPFRDSATNLASFSKFFYDFHKLSQDASALGPGLSRKEDLRALEQLVNGFGGFIIIFRQRDRRFFISPWRYKSRTYRPFSRPLVSDTIKIKIAGVLKGRGPLVAPLVQDNNS